MRLKCKVEEIVYFLGCVAPVIVSVLCASYHPPLFAPPPLGVVVGMVRGHLGMLEMRLRQHRGIAGAVQLGAAAPCCLPTMAPGSPRQAHLAWHRHQHQDQHTKLRAPSPVSKSLPEALLALCLLRAPGIDACNWERRSHVRAPGPAEPRSPVRGPAVHRLCRGALVLWAEMI